MGTATSQDDVVRLMSQPFGNAPDRELFVDRHPHLPYFVSLLLFAVALYNLAITPQSKLSVSLITAAAAVFCYAFSMQHMRHSNSLIFVIGAWLVIGIMSVVAIISMVFLF